jgi:hypothetical protein
MAWLVNGRTAKVHADLARRDGRKLFLRSCQRIKDSEHFLSFIETIELAALLFAPYPILHRHFNLYRSVDFDIFPKGIVSTPRYGKETPESPSGEDDSGVVLPNGI